VRVFHGTWTEYTEHRETQRLAEQAAASEAKRAASNTGNSNGSSRKRKHKNDGLSDYQRQRRVTAVEKRITELETRLEEITAEISDASTDGDAAAVQSLGEAYAETETDLQTAMSEWEALLDG